MSLSPSWPRFFFGKHTWKVWKKQNIQLGVWSHSSWMEHTNWFCDSNREPLADTIGHNSSYPSPWMVCLSRKKRPGFGAPFIVQGIPGPMFSTPRLRCRSPALKVTAAARGSPPETEPAPGKKRSPRWGPGVFLSLKTCANAYGRMLQGKASGEMVMVLWSHDFAGKAGDIPKIIHFKLFPIPFFMVKCEVSMARSSLEANHFHQIWHGLLGWFPQTSHDFMLKLERLPGHQGTAIPTLGEFRIGQLNLSLHPQSILLKYKLLRHLHHCFYALIQYPSSVGSTSTICWKHTFWLCPSSIHILGSGTKDLVVNMLARETKNSFFDRWYALFCWDLHTSSFAIARILAPDISPWFEHLISTPHRMLSNCWFGASSLCYDSQNWSRLPKITERILEMILK